MHRNPNEIIWKVDSSVRYRRLFNEAVLIHQEKAEALVLAPHVADLPCSGLHPALANVIRNHHHKLSNLTEQLGLQKLHVRLH
jgi:hypothetical protein